MPIYEYRCDNCGHEFETIQKLSEAALTTCPACEKEALRKKVSAAGFRLKGGGWYETDFKSDKKRNVAGDEKAGDGASKEGGNGGKSSEKASGDAGKSDGAGSKPAGESGKSGSESKGTGSTSKTTAAD